MRKEQALRRRFGSDRTLYHHTFSPAPLPGASVKKVLAAVIAPAVAATFLIGSIGMQAASAKPDEPHYHWRTITERGGLVNAAPGPWPLFDLDYKRQAEDVQDRIQRRLSHRCQEVRQLATASTVETQQISGLNPDSRGVRGNSCFVQIGHG